MRLTISLTAGSLIGIMENHTSAGSCRRRIIGEHHVSLPQGSVDHGGALRELATVIEQSRNQQIAVVGVAQHHARTRRRRDHVHRIAQLFVGERRGLTYLSVRLFGNPDPQKVATYRSTERQSWLSEFHTRCRGCFSLTSDSHDCDFAPRSPDEPLYVVRVTCENRGFLAKSQRHHNGIDNVRRSGHGKQPPCLVRFALAKGNDHAPSQEAPELDLLWGPADLGGNGRRNQWNNAQFQADLVFSPSPPLVSIGRNQHGGVIDDGAHAGRRTVRDVRNCARTVRRASSISSAVNDPCCFSHKATSAKPARLRSASRAALVIHAETLTPSRAAAARTFL
jgi:hypothetical protein